MIFSSYIEYYHYMWQITMKKWLWGEADGSVSRKSVKHFCPGNRYKMRKSVSRKNS